MEEVNPVVEAVESVEVLEGAVGLAVAVEVSGVAVVVDLFNSDGANGTPFVVEAVEVVGVAELAVALEVVEAVGTVEVLEEAWEAVEEQSKLAALISTKTKKIFLYLKINVLKKA